MGVFLAIELVNTKLHEDMQEKHEEKQPHNPPVSIKQSKIPLLNFLLILKLTGTEFRFQLL